MQCTVDTLGHWAQAADDDDDDDDEEDDDDYYYAYCYYIILFFHKGLSSFWTRLFKYVY